MDSSGGRIDSRPLTAEEETVRRNTDCVYFLASPLTCKKGNECEYRHSEGARVNPRDCWYWLNGNCLNPKCLFRHPPLDGLFGTPGTTSGPAQPPSQTIAPTQIPVAHAPVYSLNKQNVPCIYFQKGHCLKGDKCPFMHGPQPTGNPVSQQVAKVSPSLSKQPQTLNSWSIKQCASQQNIHTQQNIPKASVDKPVVTSPSSAKPVSRTESPPNDLSHKSSLLFYPLVHKFPGSQPAHAPVSNGNALGRHHGHQVHSLDEYVQIGRKADEFLGESSPGFDVLVDDNIKGNGYFVNEDDLRRDSVRGGKHPDPINDYDHRHSDYKPVPKYERAQYNGNGEFERHGRIHNFYDLKPSRASSERILDRPLLPERRALPRHKSPDEVDRSDLRHQLLKQRRIDGSRSAISPDHCGESYRRDERYTEDRSRGRHSQRDQLQFPLECSMSTRLRGRITLPRRSSPDASPCLQSEEMDRARHQGLSPARPISNQGRHHERIRRRPSEEPHFAADARNFGGQPVRRDDVDFLNFAGPKSLSELKGAKSVGRSREQQTKSVTATIPREQNNVMSGKVITASIPREQNNAMSGKVTGFQEFDASLSFEGPKPLSVILKRKREEAPGNDAISSVANEHNQRDRDNTVGSSVSAAVAEVQSICVVDSSKEDIHTVSSLEAPQARTGEEEEEGLISSGAEELIYDDAQSSAKGDVLGTEDMDIDCIEDRELQNSDHRDGEFDYEAIEAGDFKTEDDESTYQEDEEELDDEDEFARKVGIFFT